MTEIEIKAHVQDPEATEAKIRSFARFHKTIIKRDVYWKQDSLDLVVRIRTEESAETNEIGKQTETLVTYKKKTINEKTEVNDEHEFCITNRLSFETLLQDLGFKITVEKTKESSIFTYDYSKDFTVTIELCDVPPLGCFIELEIMKNTKEPNVVIKAKEALISTLKMCEIPEKNIEPRFYTDMLKEFFLKK